MKKLAFKKVVMALVVETIRRLWDRGLYRTNVWLKKIHDRWFDVWVEFRMQLTMSEVDQQIKELNSESVELVDPVYWEEKQGETPLGGVMGLTYELTEDHEP